MAIGPPRAHIDPGFGQDGFDRDGLIAINRGQIYATQLIVIEVGAEIKGGVMFARPGLPLGTGWEGRELRVGMDRQRGVHVGECLVVLDQELCVITYQANACCNWKRSSRLSWPSRARCITSRAAYIADSKTEPARRGRVRPPPLPGESGALSSPYRH